MTQCLIHQIPISSVMSRETSHAALIEKAFKRIVRNNCDEAGPFDLVAGACGWFTRNSLAMTGSREKCCEPFSVDELWDAGALGMGFLSPTRGILWNCRGA
jgi:hypothetical protein